MLRSPPRDDALPLRVPCAQGCPPAGPPAPIRRELSVARASLQRARRRPTPDLPALVAFGEELRDLVIAPTRRGRPQPRRPPATARAVPRAALPRGAGRPGPRAGGRRRRAPTSRSAWRCSTVAPANALRRHPGRPHEPRRRQRPPQAPRRRPGAGGRGRRATPSSAGVEQLVVSVHPGSRDANRFFARLGFAPLAVRRTAPVAAVRRRLGQAEAGRSPTTSCAVRAGAAAARRRLRDDAAARARPTATRRPDGGRP